MARHFVGLKVALLTGAFRGSTQTLVGAVLGLVTGLPAALAIAALLAIVGRREPPLVPLLVPPLFALLGIGWVILPVVGYGLDETLDAGRLRLLPLTRRQLATGLLAASLVGLGPLASALVLAGIAIGAAPAGPEAVIVVVAAALQLAVCLAAARAVTGALSSRLRSRRGADLLASAGALLGFGIAALAQLPNIFGGLLADDPARAEAVASTAARAAGFVPTGWGGAAVAAAAQGQTLVALGWLAAQALLLAGLVRWWLRTLERSLDESSPVTAAAEADTDLFAGAARLLPRTRLGATAAKELHYLWREPQLRIQTLVLAVVSVAGVVAVGLVEPLRRPEVVLATPAVVAIFGLGTINLFGADRGAVWLIVAAEGPRPADLAGKNLGSVLLVAPLVVAATVAVAALTGGWGLVAPSLLLSVGLLGVTLAVGDVASVIAGFPMPEGGNAFNAMPGSGCMTVVLQGLAVAVQGLLAAPAVLLVALAAFLRPGLLLPAAAVAAAWGVGAYLGGVRLGALQLAARAPEFVVAMSRPT